MAGSRGTLLDPLEDRDSIKTTLDTVTARAPDWEGSRSCWSFVIYFTHICRGFSGVCLWGWGVNELGV